MSVIIWIKVYKTQNVISLSNNYHIIKAQVNSKHTIIEMSDDVCTGCSLIIVFFEDIKTYSKLWFLFLSGCVHVVVMPGR